MYFKPFHQLGFDKSIDKSNYVLEVVAPEACTACAMCVRRCPMDALQLKYSTKAKNKFRKVVEVETDLCIGCGVCVHKCKTEAIMLKKKEELTRPPKTKRDQIVENVMAVLAAKQAQAEEK
jgi:formate hydrogenlyase subunit 6/NADH:ubiquinone oxidoreductase subunit I